MGSSLPSALVSLIATFIYAYSAYYMSFELKLGKYEILIPESLKKYGQLKYLTFLTLCLQLIAHALHVLAYFIKSLEGLRDYFYTSLAYPMASVVCYSFWGVWHLMGRDQIFPAALDAVFPSWLNHAIHTIIVPVNLITSILLHHRYYNNGVFLTMLFSALYTAWLHYIRFESGHWVYPFLSSFDDRTRIVYFIFTALMTYLMYKSGQWFTYTIHGKKIPEGVRSSAQKRKQK